jgi:hypothetical protein
MKAVWFWEIILLPIGVILLVIGFVMILRLQLHKLMGLNFFISLASGSLGMRVMIAKLILDTSKEPFSKSLTKAIKSYFMIG